MGKKIFISNVEASAVGQEIEDYLKLLKRKNPIRNPEELRQAISSIPTPWAKYEFYKDALVDESHPFHTLVYNDWLGILATIMMKNIRAINITYREVQLDNALRRFLPKDLGHIEKIPVIFRKGEPIALFIEPIIVMGKLFYEFYGNDIFIELRWVDLTEKDFEKNQFLVQDVLYCREIPIDERVDFAKRVLSLLNEYGFYNENNGRIESFKVKDVFKGKLQRFLNKELSNYPKYFDDLSQFIEEQVSQVSRKTKKPISVKDLFDKALQEDYKGTRVSAYLADNILPGYESGEIKYVLLPTSKSKKEYVDRKILPGFSNTFKNRDWLFKNSTRINENLKEKNIQLINIDRHFLTYSKRNSKIFKFNNIFGIPIDWEDIKDMDPKILQFIIGKIQFSKNLDKMVISLSEEDATLIYEKDNLEVEDIFAGLRDDDKVFEVALFPYIEGYSSPIMAIAISEAVGKRINVSVNEEIIEEHEKERVECCKTDLIVYLYKLKEMPQYINISNKIGDIVNIVPLGVRFERDSKDNYHLKLDEPDVPIRDDAGEITFAIDVGTSNTYVAYSVKKDEVYDFEFSMDNLYIIDAGETQTLKTLFMNKEDFSSIFPTLIRQRNVESNTPIIGSHIYWGEIKEDLYKSIEYNIKWGETQRERKLLKMFLKQIFYHIAAFSWKNGHRKVKIKYTYPSSFPEILLSNFKDTWNEALRELQESLKLNVEMQLEDAIPEAVAVATFARAEEVDNFLAIDIGGGTTDVALWKDGKIKNIWSIKFAGNNILLDNIYCWENQEECKDDPILSDEEKKRKFKLEMKPEDIWEKLNEKELKELVLLSYLMLIATIVYLTGDLAKNTNKKGQGNEDNKSYTKIMFFGNGSRVLLREIKTNPEIYKAIEGLFKPKLTEVSIKYTSEDDLKKSVAKGALRTNVSSVINTDKYETKIKLEEIQINPIVDNLNNEDFKVKLKKASENYISPKNKTLTEIITHFLVEHAIPKLRKVKIGKKKEGPYDV